MILPREEWSRAVQRAIELLDDPETKILYADPNGAVIEDKHGNRIAATRHAIEFTTAAGRSDPPG